MIQLDREGPVFVLRMTAGENRFHPDFLRAYGEALDRVEKDEGPAALVTTGDGKFFSNGLDLDWMGSEGRERAGENLAEVLRMFARVLVFPGATVAAVNGHAFAGGGMLALAHDLRVMRADRGYFCLPEVDLGLPLHPGMTALIQAKLPKRTAHEAVVTGRRYAGAAAAAAGIVDEALAEEALLARAVELAAGLAGKRRDTMAVLKRGLYPEALRALGGS